tara:strand:- start:38930 stop:39868 length:939 start_codon:yes stop_codon:yes gene_type:complete
MKSRHAIYLHRVGAIGDTLLTSNLLLMLKNCYKKSKISMGASPNYALPLLDSGLISEIIDATSVPFHLFESSYSSEDELTMKLKKYDTVIIFKEDKNDMIKRRLKNIGIKDFAIESPFPPEKSNVHVSKWIERVFMQLKHIPNKNNQHIKLSISKDTELLSDNEIKKLNLESSFLALHPGSSSQKKCVPIEKMIKIAKEITYSYDLRLALIEGIADEKICNEFRRNWGPDIINIKVNSLEILAGILVKAKGFVGCDSGISHLSSLYGVPTLVLFGHYSNPKHWGPIGLNSNWAYWNNINDCRKIFDQLVEKN